MISCYHVSEDGVSPPIDWSPLFQRSAFLSYRLGLETVAGTGGGQWRQIYCNLVKKGEVIREG